MVQAEEEHLQTTGRAGCLVSYLHAYPRAYALAFAARCATPTHLPSARSAAPPHPHPSQPTPTARLSPLPQAAGVWVVFALVAVVPPLAAAPCCAAAAFLHSKCRLAFERALRPPEQPRPYMARAPPHAPAPRPRPARARGAQRAPLCARRLSRLSPPQASLQPPALTPLALPSSSHAATVRGHLRRHGRGRLLFRPPHRAGDVPGLPHGLRRGAFFFIPRGRFY